MALPYKCFKPLICVFILIGVLEPALYQNVAPAHPYGKIQAEQRIYLPLVLKRLVMRVPEISVPLSRWPHAPGQQLNLSYKWSGDLTNPSHTWRPAFQGGIDDWNAASTHVRFYYFAFSNNTIDMIYDPNIAQGVTALTTISGVTTQANVYGNLYWDIHWGYSNNQRRAAAAHEIGHVTSIGHIPRSFSLNVLMLEWFYFHELGVVYAPQSIDIALVNQVYP